MIIINPIAVSPSLQIIGWQGENLASDYPQHPAPSTPSLDPAKHYGVLLEFYTLLFPAASLATSNYQE